MRNVLVSLLVVLVAPMHAQDLPIVATGTQAYTVLPGELVATGTVAEARWSSDGRFVFLKQVTTTVTPAMVKALTSGAQFPGPPTGFVHLILWDVAARKAQRVWTAPAESGPTVQFGWLTGAPVALAAVSLSSPASGQARRSLLRITADGKSTSLTSSNLNGLDAIDFSPFAPMAIVRQSDERSAGPPVGSGVWWLLDSSGRLRRLPAELQGPDPTSVTWSPTGEIHAARTRQAQASGGRPAREWYRVDPKSLALTGLPAQRPSEQVARQAGLTVVKEASEVRSGNATATVPVLWLDAGRSGEHSRAFLCADGEWGLVAPTTDGVVWCARGVLWYAPIARLSAERLEQMRNQARRVATMSAGKQVALTVLMYAQDHDETLPGPDGVVEKLQPYAANSRIFDGLVYTFAGAKLGDVRSPATEELGYIPGPGGRAVLFIDGHVEWREGR